MPIFKDSNRLNGIYLGDKTIGEIYLGDKLVYQSYKETDLGLITIYGSGDYVKSYYCTAHAILVRDKGVMKLKITGYWGNTGDNVSGGITNFSTNINVGAQKNQINFNVYQHLGQTIPNTSTADPKSAYINTSGVLYLPLAHENVVRSFNKYDADQQLIVLNPA